MPDPAPDAAPIERLRSRLELSFDDYHVRSGDQRALLAELVVAVRQDERRRVLSDLRDCGVPLPDDAVERLLRR